MQSKIQGVKLVSLPTVQAARGDLTALELPQIVPFEVKRIFLVHHVSDLEISNALHTLEKAKKEKEEKDHLALVKYHHLFKDDTFESVDAKK